MLSGEIKILKSKNSLKRKNIITKWSDYRFKGGNHLKTKHSNREPDRLTI